MTHETLDGQTGGISQCQGWEEFGLAHQPDADVVALCRVETLLRPFQLGACGRWQAPRP